MDKLENIIIEMTRLFQEAIPLEQEKLKAAAARQVTFVEDCMKKEQVLLLKVRGLEQKRQSVVKELGYEGKTFREIIDMESKENQERLNPLFGTLSNAIRDFSHVNEEALKMIQLNVHELEKMIGMKNKEQNLESHITDQRV